MLINYQLNHSLHEFLTVTKTKAVRHKFIVKFNWGCFVVLIWGVLISGRESEGVAATFKRRMCGGHSFGDPGVRTRGTLRKGPERVHILACGIFQEAKGEWGRRFITLETLRYVTRSGIANSQ